MSTHYEPRTQEVCAKYCHLQLRPQVLGFRSREPWSTILGPLVRHKRTNVSNVAVCRPKLDTRIYSSSIIGIMLLSQELRLFPRVCFRLRRSSGRGRVRGPKKSPSQKALEPIYTIHRFFAYRASRVLFGTAADWVGLLICFDKVYHEQWRHL